MDRISVIRALNSQQRGGDCIVHWPPNRRGQVFEGVIGNRPITRRILKSGTNQTLDRIIGHYEIHLPNRVNKQQKLFAIFSFLGIMIE